MVNNSLEERLQNHSNAFDGLLSLIPAKYYYDGETSNQWQQKRKSKEEHQANKRQKLDPENTKNMNAKEVLKENEKTATPVVLPGEKFKLHQKMLAEQAKKDKEGEVEDDEDDEEEEDDEDEEDEQMEEEEYSKEDEENKKVESKNSTKINNEDELIKENVTIMFDDNGDEPVGNFKKESLRQQLQQQNNSSGKKQLSKEEQEAREKKHKELKAKLQAKIQTMREKRKAPGSKAPGAATSRQQILEERRKKAELKKESKKKDIESSEDEDDDDEDEEDDIEEDSNKSIGSNVMFGNIEFMDGERMSSDLTSSRKIGKKKGPANNDIKGHLKKLEREKSRIGELDKDSKKKLEDKNKWQRALASVQGIKVKDDEKLLKKALRRKESKKRKSEREWKERIQTVADEKKMKTDRREENLRIRKENRGKSRKDQVKQLPSYKRSRGNKKMPGAKRAGFEGGIRSHKKKK